MVAEGQSPLGQERHGNTLGSMTARTRICSQNCHPHTEQRKNKKKNRKWNATLKSQAHPDTSILTPLPPKMFPNSLPNGNQVSKSTPNKFTGPQTLMAMSKGKKSDLVQFQNTLVSQSCTVQRYPNIFLDSMQPFNYNILL